MRIPIPVLAAAAALSLASLAGCGREDDERESPPPARALTVRVAIATGIEVLDGVGSGEETGRHPGREQVGLVGSGAPTAIASSPPTMGAPGAGSVVAPAGGSLGAAVPFVTFPWPRTASAVDVDLLVPREHPTTWTFRLEGAILAQGDTSGDGVLYTASRSFDPATIEEGGRVTLPLDRVLPLPIVRSDAAAHRISWPEIPRAVSFELLQVRAGHPDSIFALSEADTDTTILRDALLDPRRYRVRAVLRDGRKSAFSFPLDLGPR